jgi:hypothetical protein
LILTRTNVAAGWEADISCGSSRWTYRGQYGGHPPDFEQFIESRIANC